MSVADLVARVAAELALFAGVGFLLFGLNDLAVDAIYFVRRFWRSITVYKRHRRAYASYYVFNKNPGFLAIFVPAWDESAVIASMLRATLKRLDYDDYRVFVGCYRNDPATAAAIASVADERVTAVRVNADGPTTKADCLNHLRGATAGLVPDMGAFTVEKAVAATASPIVPTEFPPISPPQPSAVPGADYAYAGYYPDRSAYQGYATYPAPAPHYVPVPVHYYPDYVPARSVTVPLPPAQSTPAAVEQPPQFYSPVPRLESFDAAQAFPQSTPDWNGRADQPPRGVLAKIIQAKNLDRMQLSAWALYRGTPGTGSLASGGTLGGSQAGARLTYAINPRIAASLRSSSPIGGSRGGEVAAGVRLTPLPAIPVAITAERRQRIGRFSTGRSDFALFAEGGLYQRPIGWDLMLDGYAQAGLVGLKDRDVFADGGFTFSRPVFGRFSLGLGAWGGYQPGLYRIDAGPRLSYRVRPNVSLHLDWRQRLAGAAQPSSGPALTLGANF